VPNLPLPPASGAAAAGCGKAPLADRLAALARELDLELAPEQCRRLQSYVELLLRWNRVHNLTAITRESDVLTHHLLDSLSIATPLRELAPCGTQARVLDVGAGAGLPGIPLAIALPDLLFTLNDAVSKKCAFMTQARLELGLRNVDVVHGRVEQLRLAPYDLIMCRALGTLASFTTLTRHLLAPEGRWLAMKGAVPEPELRELPAHAQALRTATLRVPLLQEARHLVVMRAR